MRSLPKTGVTKGQKKKKKTVAVYYNISLPNKMYFAGSVQSLLICQNELAMAYED